MNLTETQRAKLIASLQYFIDTLEYGIEDDQESSTEFHKKQTEELLQLLKKEQAK